MAAAVLRPRPSERGPRFSEEMARTSSPSKGSKRPAAAVVQSASRPAPEVQMPVGESGEGEFFEEAERLDGPAWVDGAKGWSACPLLSFTQSQTLCFLLHNRQNNRGIRQCECELRRSALATTTTPAVNGFCGGTDRRRTDGRAREPRNV